MASIEKWFECCARWAAYYAGRTAAFIGAFSIILVWAITGPFFGFSDTWQLVINTGTTIITFLMCFLLQHTQNHDTAAIHLKLDELIHANEAATNRVARAEDLTNEELRQLKEQASSSA